MRQSMKPTDFQKSMRVNKRDLVSSGRAGKVYPVADIMLLPGDSCSGSIEAEFMLAEMPKPLLNNVYVNFQAWFVPWSVFPQFSGMDEFNAALTGTTIQALGDADRDAPPLFNFTEASTNGDGIREGEFATFMGKHFPAGQRINTNAIDAFWQVYNFRQAAHSERLPRRNYAAEDLDEAQILPPAFWPSSRITRMVPDYDREMMLGQIDLDVAAGQLPVSGISRIGGAQPNLNTANAVIDTNTYVNLRATNGDGVRIDVPTGGSNVFAEMAGQRVNATLSDIDMGRSTQAFARLRDAMAGTDGSGYTNDDMLYAMTMSGLSVPPEQFKRVWSLGAQRVQFALNERHATDAANLDDSVSIGAARCRIPLNVPTTQTGGYIIVTAEVLPDRIDERAVDETWLLWAQDQLPNALRDVQRVEPVDVVTKRRIDAAHDDPSGQYAWEGMNDRWNTDSVGMGGDFFHATPGSVNTASRQALWVPQLVNPEYTQNHFLCPEDFPHDVFSLTTGSAFSIAATHSVSIVGLTQIGDVLTEDNNAFTFVQTYKELANA